MPLRPLWCQCNELLSPVTWIYGRKLKSSFVQTVTFLQLNAKSILISHLCISFQNMSWVPDNQSLIVWVKLATGEPLNFGDCFEDRSPCQEMLRNNKLLGKLNASKYRSTKHKGIAALILWFSFRINQIVTSQWLHMSAMASHITVNSVIWSTTCSGYLWPLLLTWFNFNPSMDK